MLFLMVSDLSLGADFAYAGCQKAHDFCYRVLFVGRQSYDQSSGVVLAGPFQEQAKTLVIQVAIEQDWNSFDRLGVDVASRQRVKRVLVDWHQLTLSLST